MTFTHFSALYLARPPDVLLTRGERRRKFPTSIALRIPENHRSFARQHGHLALLGFCLILLITQEKYRLSEPPVTLVQEGTSNASSTRRRSLIQLYQRGSVAAHLNRVAAAGMAGEP